jgi:hypothetical protein
MDTLFQYAIIRGVRLYEKNEFSADEFALFIRKSIMYVPPTELLKLHPCVARVRLLGVKNPLIYSEGGYHASQI